MRFSLFRLPLVALAALVLCAGLPATLPAQEVTPPPEAAGMSTAQIVNRLRASGISRAEAQQRLREAGRDPSLADPYFDIMESDADPSEAGVPAPSADFVGALQSIGIMDAGDPDLQAEVDQPPEEPEAPEDVEEAEEAEEQDDEDQGDRAASAAGGDVRIFGRDVFSGRTSEFEPLTSGPVDPDYRLGPGDRLVLILTGDVEKAYQLDVSQEGFIVIPQVGQLAVNDLTMNQLEDVLYDRLGQAYSGVRRGPDATTHFSVSLGRLRRNQVYMLGEIERRGAAQISAVATLFNALYVGGGPTPKGSFRSVRVRRQGRVIRDVDLYNYLLTGSNESDIRLENGDIVFVPLAGKRVTILGNVRRPAVFELKPGEGLMEALTYAGGFQTDAYTQRIQIDRILPPEERIPGRERVLMDINPEELAMADGELRLHDGDVIRVFGISEERMNRVTIRGDVFRPATYEFIPGMTLEELVRRADGLLPSAYHPVAHVIHLNPVDGSRYLERVPLAVDSTGALDAPLPLQDLDEVVIYGRVALRDAEWVEIDGPVRKPGRYPFADGITVKDLVLAAGGGKEDLLPVRAHISRLKPDFTRELHRHTLHPDSVGVPQDEIPLEPMDRVQIFTRSILSDSYQLRIEGPVRNPGTFGYADGTTLRDLILKAGGLRPSVFVDRAHIARLEDDFTRTLLRYELEVDSLGLPVEDIPLEPEDVVSVYDQRSLLLPRSVAIHGLVGQPGRYPLADGMTVQDLLLAAGGFDKGAFAVEIEVARPQVGFQRTDSLATVHRVELRNRLMGRTMGADADAGAGAGADSTAIASNGPIGETATMVRSGDPTADSGDAAVRPRASRLASAEWRPGADEFRLEDGDVVFVRRLPGYVEARTVQAAGELDFPGDYALERRLETLSSLVERAGGLTKEAYPRGARLVRDSVLVAIDFERALRKPGGEADIALFPGDRLVVPQRDPTVRIVGAVPLEARIPYRRGWSIHDYIERAGGLEENADHERIRVVYPNGEAATHDRFLVFRTSPHVEPGAVIHVPMKPPAEQDEGVDWDRVLSRSLSVVSTVATLMIALSRFD